MNAPDIPADRPTPRGRPAGVTPPSPSPAGAAPSPAEAARLLDTAHTARAVTRAENRWVFPLAYICGAATYAGSLTSALWIDRAEYPFAFVANTVIHVSFVFVMAYFLARFARSAPRGAGRRYGVVFAGMTVAYTLGIAGGAFFMDSTGPVIASVGALIVMVLAVVGATREFRAA